MAGNGYLRTVNFGGFDKKDVLAYVDELNTKIYNLETQLGEKNDAIAALEASGAAAASGDFEGKEVLEKQIEESHKKLDETNAKVSELMASTDSLKLQLTNAENETIEKDGEIKSLKNEIEDLKQKLSEAEANAAAGGGAAFDMSGLFMEAQKSANAVVVQAKEAAKKMEQDAKDLQDQILEDANNQAAKIVANANAEAKSTTDTANAQAEAAVSAARANADAMIKNAREQERQILSQSKGLRDSVKTEFSELDITLQKLSKILNDLLGDSSVKVGSAKELVANGLKLVDGNSNFNYDLKGSDEKQVSKKNDNRQVNYSSAVKSVPGFGEAGRNETGSASKSSLGANTAADDNKGITDPNKDMIAQLAAQALAAAMAGLGDSDAKPDATKAAAPAEKPKASIGKSLQFRDPAPDSVKPAASKAEKSEQDAPKAAKTEEHKSSGFHMTSMEKSIEAHKDAPKGKAEISASAGLSMSKNPAPKHTEKPSDAAKKDHEVTGLKMSGGKGKSSVNTRDKDMMAALAKEIQSEKDEAPKSDEDILNEWQKKK